MKGSFFASQIEYSGICSFESPLYTLYKILYTISMANNSAGGKMSGALRAVNEAVAQPIAQGGKDIAQEAIESLTGNYSNPKPQQSAAPSPQTPQEDLAKKQQEEIRKRNILGFLQQYESQERQMIQQKKQEAAQKKQAEEKENENKKIKQFEIVQKKQQIKQAVFQAQRKTEIKRGGA